MNKVFLVLSILVSAAAFSEEKAAPVDNTLGEIKSNYQINSKYKAGPFLIYDCAGQYYSCVDADSNEKCLGARLSAINEKEASYPCAPLKKFSDKEQCLIKNYEVIESVAWKRFCFPKNPNPKNL